MPKDHPNPDAWRRQKRELEKRRYHSNPETRAKAIARAAKRQTSDPEYQRRAVNAWYAKHQARVRAERNAKRAADPTKVASSQREYYHRTKESRKELRRVVAARRRALFAGEIELGEWLEALADHGNSCAYCGSTDNLEMDHVIPLSRGGEHAGHNVAPACMTCNRSKGARTPFEWLMFGGGVLKMTQASSTAERWIHAPETIGSTPTPATNRNEVR